MFMQPVFYAQLLYGQYGRQNVSLTYLVTMLCCLQARKTQVSHRIKRQVIKAFRSLDIVVI